MKNRSAGNSGFTLIEVLIATVIFSGLIYVAMLAVSMFLDSWQSKRFQAKNEVQGYRSSMLLRTAIESTLDYYVTDPANERVGIHYPFFLGDKDKIEFITRSSVFNEEAPAVAKLSFIKTASDTSDKFKVIYEETSLEKTYIRYNTAQKAFKNVITIFDSVEYFKIRYYGEWETKWVSERQNFVTSYRWQDVFDGKERKTTPQKIEITIESDSGKETNYYSIKAGNIYKRTFFNTPEF